jgi:hypothetical protein
LSISDDSDGSGNRERSDNQFVLRKVVDETVRSLGGPISKTIMWHMSNKGILSESTRIDISAFYLNLKELVGPGADMIMEETCKQLQKHYGGKAGRDFVRSSPLERIQRIMEIGEA